VTGANKGIGRETAAQLAALGMTVLLGARDAERGEEAASALRAAGGDVQAVALDVTDADVALAAARTIDERFGRLDILVNNAGILRLAPLEDFPLEDFDGMVDVNVRGLFVAAQAAVRHMGEGGRIISIGSVASVRVAFPTSSVYSMSKGAVAAMVRGMAIDLAPRGITVNNVQPGPTETDMNPSDGPHAEAIKGMIPLRRVGRPEEIAGMVAYLAGPEAAFVTGASLTIDGGYTA